MTTTSAPGAATTGQAGPASAPRTTTTANGSFVFRTANGILPTWESADVHITGVSPGSVISNFTNTFAEVTLPIVAVNGSANFAGGGFRFTNVDTGDFVNCATPVIDTKAKVVDCVTQGGINRRIFVIKSIATKSNIYGAYTRTTIYRGMTLRVANTLMADFLNDALDVNIFSPYVTFATGELTVNTKR
ncbi:MAG: hypothetical protein EXQ60_08375 [Candidatus Nanopelagicales bacterium]|nr:hypothetical protein [Candidatus Nanopelagicales bacterium]